MDRQRREDRREKNAARMKKEASKAGPDVEDGQEQEENKQLPGGDQDQDQDQDDDDDEEDAAWRSLHGKDRQQLLFQRRLNEFHNAAVYWNEERHSMMLFVVDACFGEEAATETMDGGEREAPRTKPIALDRVRLQGRTVLVDGGLNWQPRVELAHEFSLLPHIDRFDASGGPGNECEDGESQQLWGGVTKGCSSVADMQNRLFQLGFGPYPYFRRSGVLVYMSPSELNDDDTEEYMLGCIVAHRCGVNGCCHDPWGIKVNGRATKFKTAADAPEDLQCYFCVDNPFYEVLFENDVPLLWVSAANSSDGDGGKRQCKTQTRES